MSAEYSQSLMSKKKIRTISIASGKGGVGKTTLVSNLARQMARKGQKVLVLDGDMTMANLHLMFGVSPKSGIADVVKGQVALRDVVCEVAPGVSLIPGGSGIYELNHLTNIQKRDLLDQVNELEDDYDVMLIDTAPGIDDDVLYLSAACQEILVVMTPDPASLADAYALIKVLNKRHKETKFSIVCNMVRDEAEALTIYRRLTDVASRFLYVSLEFKGFIPLDQDLRKATKQQQLVSDSSPCSPSSLALRGLSEKLGGEERDAVAKGGIQFFWGQIVGVA